MTRRTRLPALVAGTALVAAALACATPATAAPGDVDLDLCVGTPVWTGGFDDEDEGKPLHGLTTTRGTTPEEFQGEFITRIDDAFGNDIYLVKLRGSRITKADGSIDAGIWAGISGSPVYDADDNLVGSVSYGFTGSQGSDIAGVTPAANIFATEQVDEPDETVQAQKSVPVSKAARADVAAAGSRSGPSLKSLTLPKFAVGASVDAREHGYFVGKSRTLSGRAADFGPAGSAAGADSIEPGGNIATSWSSGDLLFASVGTVTAVCDNPRSDQGDKVFAYGHPDENLGDSDQTMHSATTLQVIADGPDSGKLVNINPVAEGAVIDDGTNGVFGVLGETPDQVVPVTTTTSYAGKSQSHTTSVSELDAVSSVVATQIFGETAAALGNGDGAGAGNVTWNITYLREGSSTPAVFTRSQFVSSEYEFGYDIVNEVASDVEVLQGGSDENITVTGVNVSSSLTSRYFKGLKVSGIQVKSGSTYKPVATTSTIKVKKGAKLEYKVVLKPSGNDSKAGERLVTMPSLVTSKSYGSTGTLRAYGALNDEDFEDEEFYYDDEEYYFDDEEDYYYEAMSFAELLKELQSPLAKNTTLGQLRYSSGGSKTRLTKTLVANPPAVVTGSKTYKISFTK